jgi:hypothetical protein
MFTANLTVEDLMGVGYIVLRTRFRFVIARTLDIIVIETIPDQSPIADSGILTESEFAGAFLNLLIVLMMGSKPCR